MKIAAYCRVSTDKDEQMDSLIHQKEFFAEYAKRNGHELFRLYADEGITGTSLKLPQKPSLKSLKFKQTLPNTQVKRMQPLSVRFVTFLQKTPKISITTICTP